MNTLALTSFTKRLNIRMRILLPMLAVITLGVVSLVAYSSHVQFGDAEESARRHMREMARAQSTIIVRVMEDALAGARTNARWSEALVENGAIDRASYADALHAVLKGNPGLTGIYAGFDPNFDGRDAEYIGSKLGDDKGRFLIYAFRGKDGTGLDVAPLTGDPAEENWYHKPMREQRETVTPPYYYAVDGKDVLMSTVVAPVVVKGKSVGVATADLALTDIQTEVGALRPLGVGHAVLVSSDGQWVAHPDPARLGKPAGDPMIAASLTTIAAGSVAEHNFTGSDGEDQVMVMVPVRFGRAAEVWGFGVVVPRAAMLAEATATRTNLLLAGLLILALVAVLAMTVGTSLSRPIRAMTQAMGRLAEGDLAVAIPHADRQDEIGAMSKAVQVFKDNACRMEEMRRHEQELEEQTRSERRKAMLEMAAGFEAEVAALVRTLTGAAAAMQTTADAMSHTASEVMSEAQVVTEAAHEASANVQTVASATEELSSSIAEISRQVSDSAQIATQAVRQADQSRAIMDSLTSSAQRIGEVVDLISQIASQTNLLALNATIEAARAGEAGKGFAVVAGEVKSLATQTAKATGEISAQIAAVQSASRQAAEAISAITATIARISEISAHIAGAVEQQGAATREISRNVAQAADGTSLVSKNIAGVNHAVGETGQGAAQVLAAADQLSREAGILGEHVDQFLESIRAA